MRQKYVDLIIHQLLKVELIEMAKLKSIWVKVDKCAGEITFLKGNLKWENCHSRET
jgi:hypothetical protein